VYESAPEVKELGVGITLLPHAMREMTALGLGEVLTRQGIENRDSSLRPCAACSRSRGSRVHGAPARDDSILVLEP
jgi:hypothetical protein